MSINKKNFKRKFRIFFYQSSYMFQKIRLPKIMFSDSLLPCKNIISFIMRSLVLMPPHFDLSCLTKYAFKNNIDCNESVYTGYHLNRMSHFRTIISENPYIVSFLSFFVFGIATMSCKSVLQHISRHPVRRQRKKILIFHALSL